MLQQAVVWDMGYVAAADLGYIKVYTKCGMRIGYQMGNVSLCAATNGITPVHGAMWADGGTDDVVPVSEMQRHEWNDAGVAYTILAIHLSGDPNSYGKCVMPSMIVPCVVYDASTADKKDWCSPEHGEIVQQWLELEKTEGVLVAESSGWQKAALPVTITSVVLLLLVLIAAFIFWRKIRDKQHQIEDYYEQKRAILGGRGSDAFSMMDDIDFILEAPGRSFIEKGCVAWNTLENMLLIMEFMELGDLQYVLQYQNGDKVQVSTGNNSIDEFSWASHKAKIARDISCGLQYLHSLKPIVVHRDLKSKNVLIGDNYEAKLSDFGVSRTRRGDETMTSGVGTAYWTAPEVLAGHKYSEKADIYSLGVVLAELDTGELPFYDARTSDGDKMEAIHVLSLVRVDRRPKWSWVSSSDCWKADQSGDFWKLDKAMASGGYDVDYAALGLTPERFEAFKTVFSSVDKAHTGAILTRQLDALCFQLGETLDQEELAVAAASLADPKTGLIHFTTFLPWSCSERLGNSLTDAQRSSDQFTPLSTRQHLQLAQSISDRQLLVIAVEFYRLNEVPSRIQFFECFEPFKRCYRELPETVVRDIETLEVA
ncbi:hypothetical protein JG688_00016235 [Phytophthora aleatoria]|uniref:Protein kinase domain-containing protein n=1 Tax=Phytophthora aleatoria TaxID=2496075 RepID=A0A8J5I8Q9_9STRA|nr:hypothetical protein JG688_00016235 [Phytophthora aleatoria]